MAPRGLMFRSARRIFASSNPIAHRLVTASASPGCAPPPPNPTKPAGWRTPKPVPKPPAGGGGECLA